MQSTSTTTKSAARNSFYNFLAYGVPILLTLFLTPLIIKRLGIEAYGVFMLANITTGLMSLLRFGLGYGVTKTVSQHFGSEEKKQLVGKVISSTLTVLVGVGCIGAFGLIAIGSFGAHWFSVSGNLFVSFPMIFALAGITFIILSAGAAFTNAIVAAHRADLQAKLYLTSMVVMNAAMIMSVYAGHGVLSLMIVQVISATLLVGAYWVTLHRIIPGLRIQLRYSHEEFQPLIQMNTYVFIHELAANLLTELDKVLLGAFLTPVAVSYYSVAGTVSQKIQGSMASITAVFLPVASTGSAQGDLARVRSIYRDMMRLTIVFATGLALVASIFGKQLLDFWVGAEFGANSLYALYLLCGTYLLLSLYTTLWHFLLGIGAVRFVAYATLTLAALNVAMLVPFIIYGGVTGTALAYLLSFAPLPYIISRGERKYLGLMDARKFFSKRVLKIGVVAIGYGSGLWFLVRPLAHSLLGVIGYGGVALVGYVMVMKYIGEITGSEWTRVVRPFINMIRPQSNFEAYASQYLVLPGCQDNSLLSEYQHGNLVRIDKPIHEYYNQLIREIREAVMKKEGRVIMRVSDGEAYFLSGKLIGNGPRRHYTSAAPLKPAYIDKFRKGLLAADSRHIEMYKNNQRAFRRLFGKDIFSPIPFECIYALISSGWLLRQPYRIGIIGSDKKIEIIQNLLTHEEYRSYIGRAQFEQYIGVPERGSSNNVDELASQIIGQLDSKIDIYLVGIGIAKLAILPQLKAHSHAVFLDVGAGLSALAGLVSDARPYFANWVNFRLKDYNYETVDRMDSGESNLKITYL